MKKFLTFSAFILFLTGCNQGSSSLNSETTNGELYGVLLSPRFAENSQSPNYSWEPYVLAEDEEKVEYLFILDDDNIEILIHEGDFLSSFTKDANASFANSKILFQEKTSALNFTLPSTVVLGNKNVYFWTVMGLITKKDQSRKAKEFKIHPQFYNASAAIALQKENLMDIYRANPGNSLNWNEHYTSKDVYIKEVSSQWTGTIVYSHWLTSLNLTNQNLSQLPTNYSGLEELNTLYLDGNHLIDLPKEVAQIPKLKKLSIKRNMLRTLPQGLGRLETLDLSDNPNLSGNTSDLGLCSIKTLNIKGTNMVNNCAP